MTLTVHHLQVSQSERIPWLCEELGIPYELVLYKRDPLFSPPELRDLSALGAAPVISDTSPPYSEAQPLKLAESAAIVEYIVQKHGGGKLMLPPTHKDYVDYLYWWHFANGNLQAGLSRQNSVRAVTSPDNPLRLRFEKRLHATLAHIDEQLSKGPWLAGEEFTVAEIMTVFSLTTMRTFASYSLEGYSNILAWLERCTERPAYQRAREKSDPGMKPVIDPEIPPLFEGIAQFSK